MKDLYLKRYSQRDFSEEKINQETITEILRWGQYSPSSLGLEGWKFVVVSNQEIKDQLGQAAYDQPQVAGSSHVVILMSAKGSEFNTDSKWLHDCANRREDKTQEQIAEYVNNTVNMMKMSMSDEKDLSNWLKAQTYIAAANICNGAKVNGVDSVIMEGFIPSQVEEILVNSNVKDMDKFNVSLMIPLGYAKNPVDNPEKTRFAFDKVVEFVN